MDKSGAHGPIIAKADAKAISRAAGLLREGRLVAFPTETVYGLGADATSDEAVAGVFEAKARPQFNPLIVHVADVAAARRLGRFDPAALTLADAFWPGPLTLVVPRADDCPVSLLASAGLDTLALRVPAHPVAHALLVATGRPVVAPSANPSGRLSPTAATHVAEGLGTRVAMILDGGRCAIGIESTIVGVDGNTSVLLRAGAIERAAIEAVLGHALAALRNGGDRPSAPGQLASHYAPRAAIRLAATHPEPGEALLAFGPAVPEHAGAVLNLSPGGDLREAAANLFAHLRELDATGAATIAVMPIPHVGLGEAINDRLARAAAPR
jgi:L-threonylcarbamoyladenylate synthase